MIMNLNNFMSSTYSYEPEDIGVIGASTIGVLGGIASLVASFTTDTKDITDPKELEEAKSRKTFFLILGIIGILVGGVFLTRYLYQYFTIYRPQQKAIKKASY